MLSPECLDDGGKALGELAASSGAHCSTAAGRSTNIRLVAVSHEVLCQRLCVGKALNTVIHTHTDMNEEHVLMALRLKD